MKRNILSFLFLESTEGTVDAERASLRIAENLEQLFEAADESVTANLESKKTPLSKALGEFGISDADLQLDPEGFCLVTSDQDEYSNTLTVLGTPDAMHKLAEMGWVVTHQGDVAMTNEPAEYHIRFLEIATAETGDKDKASQTANEIAKKAREFSSEPMDRSDDEANPVENEDDDIGARQKGVGKVKDGDKAEKSMHESLIMNEVNELLEMTCTGSMGTVEGGPQGIIGSGMVQKPKPYGKGTPGSKWGTKQWKVKQPIVKAQTGEKL